MPKTWGALETNKTLRPCKYDYASLFKRVTPKHSLLARCKNETYDSQTFAFMKQTEHRAKRHSLLARCKNETYDFETYAFMKQTEHIAKKPCKYDYASFFKRVIPKYSLLARCNFATHRVYDKQTSNGRLVAKTRPMTPKHTLLWNKPNAEPLQVWVCPKHEGSSKQTRRWNRANMTMPRSLSVWLQNISFWWSANSLHPAKVSAETTKAWHCLVHNWWQLLVLSVLPVRYLERLMTETWMRSAA